MNSPLYAVVMAGGAGTRFWPASRTARPKQLLPLAGERTMIQATVDRLEGLVSPERTLVITNKSLVEPIREQLPKLPAESVIGEPCKRDTAPCIALAAVLVRRLAGEESDPAMLVLPADHVIEPRDAFQHAVGTAEEIVAAQPRALVTFGIPPAYAAEAFGYIERGAPLDESAGKGAAYRVARFREKPSAETAREYLAAGGFYWNAGIFVWKASEILAALARFEPEMHSHIASIAAGLGGEDFDGVLDREFSAIAGKSIDYAVLERHENVVVIEAPFAWDDVGNWSALARRLGADERGNTIIGRHAGVDTSGCVIRGESGHTIVTVGLSDCIVVHTADATLVASRDSEESIRKAVDLLRKNGWKECL